MAAAAFGALRVVVFLAETFGGINYLVVMTWIPIASGQCGEKSRPALDGLRQEKFNLNLPTGLDLFPQSGKGNFAVNAATLAHHRRQVKPDFLRQP
jgi:hypothetical protein